MPDTLDPTWAHDSPAGRAHTRRRGDTREGMAVRRRVELGRSQLRKASAAKSLQSCPTLCNPIDGSPAGSPVPGILQARALEWVAISFSNA